MRLLVVDHRGLWQQIFYLQIAIKLLSMNVNLLLGANFLWLAAEVSASAAAFGPIAVDENGVTDPAAAAADPAAARPAAVGHAAAAGLGDSSISLRSLRAKAPGK